METAHIGIHMQSNMELHNVKDLKLPKTSIKHNQKK